MRIRSAPRYRSGSMVTSGRPLCGDSGAYMSAIVHQLPLLLPSNAGMKASRNAVSIALHAAGPLACSTALSRVCNKQKRPCTRPRACFASLGHSCCCCACVDGAYRIQKTPGSTSWITTLWWSKATQLHASACNQGFTSLMLRMECCLMSRVATIYNLTLQHCKNLYDQLPAGMFLAA